METEGLFDSPIVIAVLLLIGLIILLKVLGLAVRVIVLLAVLAAAGFAFYLAASGAPA